VHFKIFGEAGESCGAARMGNYLLPCTDSLAFYTEFVFKDAEDSRDNGLKI
jgi:hypothetical protein